MELERLTLLIDCWPYQHYSSFIRDKRPTNNKFKDGTVMGIWVDHLILFTK